MCGNAPYCVYTRLRRNARGNKTRSVNGSESRSVPSVTAGAAPVLFQKNTHKRNGSSSMRMRENALTPEDTARLPRCSQQRAKLASLTQFQRPPPHRLTRRRSYASRRRPATAAHVRTPQSVCTHAHAFAVGPARCCLRGVRRMFNSEQKQWVMRRWYRVCAAFAEAHGEGVAQVRWQNIMVGRKRRV